MKKKNYSQVQCIHCNSKIIGVKGKPIYLGTPSSVVVNDHFVATWPYLDGSMCMLNYKNVEHLTSLGKHCSVTMVPAFHYALGTNLSKEMKCTTTHIWIVSIANHGSTHKGGSCVTYEQWCYNA